MHFTWLQTPVFIIAVIPIIAQIKADHTDVILLGATGDLAKKYLWQGLFNLFQQELKSGNTFSFYGCARRLSNDEGQVKLNDILKSSIKCSDESCQSSKTLFLSRSKYRQLKHESDFRELGVHLNNSEPKAGHPYLRIFYMSIPPFSYADIAGIVSTYCRPVSHSAKVRVVFEKPFGHDLYSAQQLAGEISQYFSDEEVYRIDHYIGKSVVQQILPFRSYERVQRIWNRHHVSRVDIVLEEEACVKDRVAYYDEYGVICDVIQNHLMELLVLVAMEMPNDITNSSVVQLNKLNLLGDIRSLNEESVLLGQYEGYREEVLQQNSSQTPSDTPTFATILMFVDNPRWQAVPFVLMSGKKLAARESYVKLHIRDDSYDFNNDISGSRKDKEIIFQINGGTVHSPAIFVSNELASLLSLNVNYKMTRAQDYDVIFPEKNVDAYSTLIKSVYKGHQDQFINTEHLLKSWKIWSPLLSKISTRKPVIYHGGKHSNRDLRFRIEGSSLKFLSSTPETTLKLGDFNGTYRGDRLIMSSLLSNGGGTDLTSVLEDAILLAAQKAVSDRGTFHLALSGGSSPLGLFRKLADSVKPFPWKNTHIWMVDERCVPYNDSLSNFKALWENLLMHVRVPYWNVHPMPVVSLAGLCLPWEERQYANEISHYIPDLRFDFMLLGLGHDGHTASIFPGETHRALVPENTVFYSYSTSVKRMSLSYEIINKCREIGVLVTSKGKSEILKTIVNSEDVNKYPVTGIRPVNGQLTWYVDTEAWLGR